MILTAFYLPKANAQVTGPPEGDLADYAGDEIVAVRFVGNHELSSDELATVVQTKVTGIFPRMLHSFFLTRPLGDTFHIIEPAAIAADTARLNSHYRDNGFLDAKSRISISRNKEDVRAYYDYIRRERLARGPSKSSDDLPKIRDTVTFSISEGNPYTISRIAITGLENLPDEFQPQLTENVTIKSGERWSRAAAYNEVNRLTNFLVENGYPNVRADTTVVSHTEGYHSVTVSFYFHPGHRYRYGAPYVVFDTTSVSKSRVDDDVILAQLFTDSGHWYKLSEVRRSEQSLYKLGVFDLARVSLDTNYINHLPDSLRDSSAVPVQVFVRMQRTAATPVSVYAGTGSQGLVAGATLGFNNKNFTGTADNFNFQAAWQPLPPTQGHSSLSVDYVRPYIGMGRIPLITGAAYSQQAQYAVPTDTSIHTYTEQSYSLHLGSSIVLSKLDDKTTLTPDILVADVNTQTADSTLAAQLPKTQYNLLPSLGYQDNRVNDPVNPTSGDILTALLEVGPLATLLGKPASHYIKLEPQVRWFYDLTDHGGAVIATRLHAGASYLLSNDPSHDPSLDHRFYGGGGNSIRGWGEQELIVSNDPHRPPNIGGYNILEATLEMRYAPFQYAHQYTGWQSFSSSIRLVLFYDIGNVWDNVLWTNGFQFNQLAQTIGLGLRYNMFFGALRVDWGLKLYDPTGAFSSAAQAATPSSHGAWLFSSARAAVSPLIRIGNTFNWHFGIGQAF